MADRHEVRVREYTYRRSVLDRFGHRVRVKEWPSEEGLATLRRHYKRKHPRAFRASIKKGVQTRSQTHFWKLVKKEVARGDRIARKVVREARKDLDLQKQMKRAGI